MEHFREGHRPLTTQPSAGGSSTRRWPRGTERCRWARPPSALRRSTRCRARTRTHSRFAATSARLSRRSRGGSPKRSFPFWCPSAKPRRCVSQTMKALEKAVLQTSDIDIVELNEAFASQSLACMRLLGLDEEKVNVNGGAIALGHPLGSSGARLVGTLVREMGHRDAEYGLATMCIGVGQGIASIWQRI